MHTVVLVGSLNTYMHALKVMDAYEKRVELRDTGGVLSASGSQARSVYVVGTLDFRPCNAYTHLRELTAPT